MISREQRVTAQILGISYNVVWLQMEEREKEKMKMIGILNLKDQKMEVKKCVQKTGMSDVELDGKQIQGAITSHLFPDEPERVLPHEMREGLSL